MSSHSEKPASAAAMDALDLDDLFLEGDDGPSLFADMEIDLGDMGGIFDSPGGGAGPAVTNNNQRGLGAVLTQEFGRPNSAASSNRGKRVRTAKTNPHLLAAAAQQDGGNDPAQKRQSAIQKELQRLQDSSEAVMFGETTSSKRKRRRSKKNQDEEEPNKDKEAETATGKAASKSKRRRSSKTNTQQIDILPPQSQQPPPLQQQQQALQQIFHQMNPQQQERLQKKAEAMGLNIFASSANSTAPQNQSQSDLIKQQDKISGFGLKSSTTFYPFCALPPELDIKRGQKIFPALEKINSTSAPSSHHHHTNTDSNLDDDQQLHPSASATMSASSPLYTLFHQHLGLIQNSDRGISDLVEAVKLTHTSIKKEGGKKRVAQELSKLLTQCLKQSGFIKQTLSNLESFVKGGGGRWNDAEIQSVFPDQKPAAGTSAATSSSLSPVVATNANILPSKRGTANAPTHGGPNVTPIISVRVKVRVSGWREKSGAKLTARLWCPPGWKVAMNRDNLKAETKKAASEQAPSPVSTTTTKSTASRKRKAKDSAASSSTTNKSAVLANRGATSKIAVPFVSGHQYDQQNQQDATTKQNQEHQDSILHNLYTKILRPSISPTQRRELLANEISSTLSRLESARLTHQWTRARKLQVQMKALQSVYKDDIDIVPDMCNTIGMWRWIEHTNYFKDIEEKDEVYQELEDFLHEEEEEGVFESKGSVLEEGSLWGSSSSGLSGKRRVSAAVSRDGSEDKEENGISNDQIEPSPLFDRLQSLLVEVDGSDDDEEEDDDDLIASLPQFSSSQFINGPAGDDDEDNKDMIDVSALTLDQRTYIQLRAAGLIDATTTPPSSVLKRALPSATSDNENGESIDSILKEMKMRLSNLQSKSNKMKVKALQREALLHVKQVPDRKQREREEDIILTKYKQLQKLQKEQKEERKRSSSRAKAGTTKFDGDDWLPW